MRVVGVLLVASARALQHSYGVGSRNSAHQHCISGCCAASPPVPLLEPLSSVRPREPCRAGGSAGQLIGRVGEASNPGPSEAGHRTVQSINVTSLLPNVSLFRE
eukprot:11496588-Alexandrium_andersonii.AAC.1